MRAFLAVSACHNLALIDTYTKKLFLREQAEHGIPLLQMIVLLYNISALLSSPGFNIASRTKSSLFHTIFHPTI